MIDELEVRNFRCFEHLKAKCKRFNIIVGESGSGKTALLEAMFLTLGGNLEVGIRLKQHRGFDTAYSAPAASIEAAIWRDYFYNMDWAKPISITLSGSGAGARSLYISRGASETLFPSGEGDGPPVTSLPLEFTWQDAYGRHFTLSPKLMADGGLPSSLEYLPDFFLFAANHVTAARENAGRFSELSIESDDSKIVDVFRREYPWITGLDVQVIGGSPMICASIEGQKRKLPLNSVSGGISRVVSVMLALACRPKSVVLVDEIEHGLYHRHKAANWRGLLSLARDNDAQMFVTTHDEEWLDAVVNNSGTDLSDIALWRLERTKKNQHVLRQFSGDTFKASIETGGEVR